MSNVVSLEAERERRKPRCDECGSQEKHFVCNCGNDCYHFTPAGLTCVVCGAPHYPERVS